MSPVVNRIGRTLGLSIAVLIPAIASPVQAQDAPSVRAYLDRNSVAVNQPFVLSVEVAGVRGLDGEPEFPELESFARYLGSSQSTSMQVVNGQAAVSVTVQYRWIATVEGTHEIPALAVRAGGQTLNTEPVTLTVGPGSGASQPNTAGPGQAAEGGPVVAEDDLFIVTEVDDRTVFENQPVFVSYRIFTRVNVNSYQVTSSPSTEGFWAEQLPAPREGFPVEQVTRDGVRYATQVVRRVALFPTGAGSRSIAPLTVEARVRVERRSGDPFSDFFGGRSLFGTLAPVVVASQPVEVEVRPLPGGAPPDFRGFVGELGLTSRVDRSTVDAGEAITFTVTASGAGNLRGLPVPEIEFPPDFEVFDPEVTDDLTLSPNRVGGTKTFEYVLIPRAPGNRSLPSVSMAYFDPDAGSYRTASAPALPLEVTGTAPVIGTGGLRSGVETLREDIRFIQLGAPRLHRTDRGLLQTPGFWIFALLPLVGVTGAAALRRHQDRMAGDVAYARGRRAGRVAKKRLSQARSLAADGDREFYAEAARALQGFLADKLNLPEAGLMTEAVRAELDRRGVSDGIAAEYLDCIAHCDRQRFAPSGGGVSEHERFLDRCERGMTELDRELAR